VKIATRVAEWIAGFDLDRVPSEVRRRACLCCLDTVGVALAGIGAPSVRAAARAFASDGGYGFWGLGQSGSHADACFVNATAAAALADRLCSAPYHG